MNFTSVFYCDVPPPNLPVLQTRSPFHISQRGVRRRRLTIRNDAHQGSWSGRGMEHRGLYRAGALVRARDASSLGYRMITSLVYHPFASCLHKWHNDCISFPNGPVSGFPLFLINWGEPERAPHLMMSTAVCTSSYVRTYVRETFAWGRAMGTFLNLVASYRR